MPLTYSVSALDRAAEQRRDERWLEALREDPASRLITFQGLLVPVTGEEAAPLILAPSVAEREAGIEEEAILLGLLEGVAWFVLAGKEAELSDGRLVELRALASLVPAAQANLLAYARALLHWHARNGYCANCGTATLVLHGGLLRRCPACGADHFPRTDPAVIVLVTHGEQCLLGRSARFPPGMYSTLAGFVEPGESLEGCLRREVLEEAGIEIVDPLYRASQPWPFPQSLMLGFRARALSTKLRLDPEEIEDALWVSRDVLKDPERRPVRLPGPDSIARFLIEEWLAEG